MAGRKFAHSHALSNEYAFGRREQSFGASLTPTSNATEMSSAVRMSWICSVMDWKRAASCGAFTCNGAIGSAR